MISMQADRGPGVQVPHFRIGTGWRINAIAGAVYVAANNVIQVADGRAVGGKEEGGKE